MKKQWKLDNKGMTLLEVIVAFAIFAIAATILITGFNGALKVMGNSESIKNASQKNASGLDVYGTTFEQMEGLKDLTQITKDENTVLTFDGYKISGALITATTAKTNDKTEMSLKMFEPDTNSLITPTVPTPSEPSPASLIPKIPDKGSNAVDAYYNPDPDLKWDIYNPDKGQTESVDGFYIGYGGYFESNRFNNYTNKYTDKLYKGVITTTPDVLTYMNFGDDKYFKYFKQLYFINENPINYIGVPGESRFVVNFVYLGSENGDENRKNTIAMINNGKNETSKFILKAYETYNKLDPYTPTSGKVLLYLPKDLTINAYGKTKYGERDDKIINTATLPAGFYSVPDQTDILEVAYDKNKFNQFLTYKTVPTAKELETMGILTK